MVRWLRCTWFSLALGGCAVPELSPRARADGLYVQAQSAFLERRYDDAQKFFDQVKALNPIDPRLPAA